jgi:NADP-dependent 3-hydroxy acid dehydrogenase YdfG
MKSAVIVGASSGIGRALAATLSAAGYRVGVVARRTDLLTSLRAELPGPCVIKTVDVRTVDTHIGELRRKLEADPSAPRHILTVRKAGYRLAP